MGARARLGYLLILYPHLRWKNALGGLAELQTALFDIEITVGAEASGPKMPFFENAKLFSRTDIRAQPHLVPAARGVYAWFFRVPPPLVPIGDCYVRDVLTLLYVGISPKNERSRQHLRNRITYHYCGNAEGSTLRLTLGTLLTGISDFPLRRVGSGRRMTFTHLGEQWLDLWLEQNAFVCWVEHDEPWLLEHELLQSQSLPLNIQDNRHHPFCFELSHLRQGAKQLAREMPIANEGNQQRRMAATE